MISKVMLVYQRVLGVAGKAGKIGDGKSGNPKIDTVG